MKILHVIDSIKLTQGGPSVSVPALAECLRRFVARKNEGWSERVRAKISHYTIEKATEGLARAMAAQS